MKPLACEIAMAEKSCNGLKQCNVIDNKFIDKIILELNLSGDYALSIVLDVSLELITAIRNDSTAISKRMMHHINKKTGLPMKRIKNNMQT